MNSLIKYTPAFSSLRQEIDRLFDDFFTTSGNGNGTAVTVWQPNADVSETEDRYVLRLDVPGMSRNDLTVELREGMLTISGERKSEHEEKNENVHRIERSFGRFFRSFTLPYAGDADGVKAHMHDGVLTVEVPKREEVRPRRIEIS